MFENLSKLGEWLKKIWLPVAGFIGAITLIVQFVELWRGNQEVVTWVTTILSLIVLVSLLIWVGFGKSENTNKLLIPENYSPRSMQFPKFYRYAQSGLLLLVLFTVGAGYSLYKKTEDSNKKVVVLITNFDGPNSQKYRVTEIILENIYSALKEYDDVELVMSDTTVKSFSEAKNEGKRHNATIVIWGWYSATNDLARVTIHFDILNSPNTIPSDFMNQETMRDFQIGEFQNYSVQEQLSDEMTFLSLTTVGLVRYSLRDWNGAIESFKNALNYTKNEGFIKETQYYIELSELSNSFNTVVTPAPESSLIFIASQNIPQGSVITIDALSFAQEQQAQ